MMRRFAVLAVALLLVGASSAIAHQEGVSGSVLRVDPQSRVIVFDDGRMVQAGPEAVIVTNGQRAAFGTLEPGSVVTVYSAQPVMLRNGRYVPLTVNAPAASVGTSNAYSQAMTEPLPPTFYQASGTVKLTDPTSHRIEFMDGRHIGLTKDTEVLANGQPVELSTLTPGTPVVVRSVSPFDGGEQVTRSEAAVASGTVARVEPGNAVVLSDGRVIRTTPGTVIVVDNQPVAPSAVQPGSRVVIYQNGAESALPAAVLQAPLTREGGLRQWENEIQAP